MFNNLGKPVGVPPISGGIDINGDGMTDLFYMGGGAWTPAYAIATSTGSSFSAGATQTIPSGVNLNACYEGNFDGSGRAGLAYLGAGSITYARSTGTGYGTFTTQSIAAGNLTGQRTADPQATSPPPHFAAPGAAVRTPVNAPHLEFFP